MKENIHQLTCKKLKWLNITAPTEETITYLRNTFDFHELDFEDLESRKIQRSKIDDYENYLFIVLHIPVYHKGRDRLISVQIDIFVGPDYLITIHSGMAKGLDATFEKCKKNMKFRDELMDSGSGYLLYEITSRMFDDAFPLLDELENEINSMEVQVFNYDLAHKDMLKDILLFKKDLITFNRIIFPQRTVIAQLEHKNKKFLPPNLDVYFDDVVDKVEKIWNTIENLQQMVQSLQDINESVISHNTNKIIKTLTVFSVMLMPLTLISGIYGMNLVELPYAGHPDSFFLVLGGMLVIALLMLLYFKYRKWI